MAGLRRPVGRRSATPGVRWVPLLALGTLAPTPAASAQVELSGYVLGVGSRSGSTAVAGSSTGAVGRARLIADATGGDFDADVAYEHRVSYSGEGSFVITAAGATGTRDWLGADWEVWSNNRAEWRHRFDRLSVGFGSGAFEVRAGRQAISWATTLFLTPADPFAPFDPSDPFRVYRGGVDAVRVRYFPGPFSELEAVVRATSTARGTTTTALARGQTSAGGWALGAWAGVVHDEAAGAVFATGALGANAIRTELSLRDGPSGAVLRGALGVDRYLTHDGKDIYLLAEIQHDGFGAGDSSELLGVLTSEAFAQGELQTLSRWSLAGQASYQAHPLVSLDAMALVSLVDPSMLVAPGLSWSATSSTSVRVGVFAGFGEGWEDPGNLPPGPVPPGSEYGIVPTIGYLAITRYF